MSENHTETFGRRDRLCDAYTEFLVRETDCTSATQRKNCERHSLCGIYTESFGRRYTTTIVLVCSRTERASIIL